MHISVSILQNEDNSNHEGSEQGSEGKGSACTRGPRGPAGPPGMEVGAILKHHGFAISVHHFNTPLTI